MDRFSDRGSTPLISTKSRRHPMRVPSAFELIWRESNGSVVNACQWHAEPTLTEPAGENSTPLISTTHFHVRENVRKTPTQPSFTAISVFFFLENLLF